MGTFNSIYLKFPFQKVKLKRNFLSFLFLVFAYVLFWQYYISVEVRAYYL